MKENNNMSIRHAIHMCTSLQVRETSSDEGASRVISGYAVLFNTESEPLWSYDDSEAREIIAPEAITKELLDGCDIKFTMFHDRQLILARSNKGSGSLTYDVDEKGVRFEFSAPRNADGDKAVELVKRGDVSGCSFAFTTRYYDRDYVERTSKVINGVNHILYRVKAVTGIYDFTLAADPAYPATSVEARQLREMIVSAEEPMGREDTSLNERVMKQINEMREVASISFV